MEDAYQRTLARQKYLEDFGYKVVVKWGCELEREMRVDPQMRRDIMDVEVVTPLTERSAFYGGRTNATTLLAAASEGSSLRYADFCSLYPNVCKKRKYPIGHPTVICGEKASTDISRYFGVAMVKVLPPTNLYHPVLPYRTREKKLVFGLCKACMDSQQPKCDHTPAARAFVGSWLTPELDEAVRQGYQILHTYEVG